MGPTSLGITSNLVFSEWERIFANPMATAAAIDRVVHHSALLEFDVLSYRTNATQQRDQAEEVNRQSWLTPNTRRSHYQDVEMGWLNGGVQYSGVVISHAGVCDSGPRSDFRWT